MLVLSLFNVSYQFTKQKYENINRKLKDEINYLKQQNKKINNK
jgi:ABC-type sulfate transport system substrate-binding protein